MSYFRPPSTARVLLIDDCVDAGYLVNVSLKPLIVDQAHSLLEARKALGKTAYNLLLIDGGLPDGDGFRLCQELASHPQFKAIPKIILSGRRTVSEKVVGFNSGADDYITKPFDPIELRARVDAKLRSFESTADTLIQYGCFEFDLEFQRCFTLEGGVRTDLQLTPTEFRIFLCLCRNRGLALTRDELIQSVWTAHGMNIEKRGIDTHIRHLRKKLGPLSGVVVSVYGKGYSAIIEIT